MYNPFEIILEKLNSLENKFSEIKRKETELSKEIIDINELCKRLGITEPRAIR